MNHLTTRLRYRPADWPWAAAAFVLLPLFALLVRLVPGRVLRWAGTPASAGRCALLAGPQVVRLVDTVAVWQPVGRRCLPKALAALALARLAGVPARLVIGVRRQDDSVDAHAWIESPDESAPGGAVDTYYEIWSA